MALTNKKGAQALAWAPFLFPEYFRTNFLFFRTNFIFFRTNFLFFRTISKYSGSIFEYSGSIQKGFIV